MTAAGEPDTGTVHDLVDAVRNQAGVPADEPYRIPEDPNLTIPVHTPTPNR